MQMLRLLAIDPGAKFTGFCVMDVNVEDFRIVRIQTFLHRPSELNDKRLIRLSETSSGLTREDEIFLQAEGVESTCREFTPTEVLIENPFYNRKAPNAYLSLKEVVVRYKRAISKVSNSIRLFKYQPLHVKSVVKAKKFKGKKPMAEAIMSIEEIAEHIEEISELSEHEVDAVAIAYVRLKDIREAVNEK